MAQNVKLKGKTWSDVPSILLPKVSGGEAEFVDSSDATATADQILSGYTAYVDGEKITGEMSASATLITKNITVNGTYNASSDNADGYSQVAVNVQLPKYIEGTFKGTIAQTAFTVQVPYTGNGYPIALMVYADGGSYNSSSYFYQHAVDGAICVWSFVKANFSSTPDYTSTSASENEAAIFERHKNGNSDPTAYAHGGAYVGKPYHPSAAASGQYTPIRFNSSTEMSVYIGDDGKKGFLVDTDYKYHIIYSS